MKKDEKRLQSVINITGPKNGNKSFDKKRELIKLQNTEKNSSAISFKIC